MVTDFSNSVLNLVGNFESGGKGLYNLKYLLLSKSINVCVGGGLGYICRGYCAGKPEAGRA